MRPKLTERSERKFMAEFDPTPRMHYVYILKNARDGNLYYGYTNNLDRRLNEHMREGNYNIVYYEAYKSEQDARGRERRLKHYAQALTALKDRLKGSLS